MVKVLDREAINRMVSRTGSTSSSGGGGGDIDLAGYATMIWVTENFVSIDFFRELFRAYDSNSQEILPNDTTSVVNNIKAMVGTWTEQYLTALGNAGGGGGGGGGAQYLNDLLDVQLTTPLTDGQALVYNATLQKWVNGAAGVNMTTVWNALAGSTNEQINATHLSTALSGYVTTSDISDMATQTWVGQQGFATQTWVTSNFITIAYFDRLFRAYNGSTLVSHNDTTSTIDNIKAMFGFWTDFYLSALGTGGISTVGIGLSQLNDVTLTSPTGGQALVYNATSNKWVNGTIQTGVSTLSSLTDVLLTSLGGNQVLVWDSGSSKWVNTSLKTVNGISIFGTGDIPASGGTTGNYLPLAGGTMTGNYIWFSSSTYFQQGAVGLCCYNNILNINTGQSGQFAFGKMGTNGFVFDVNSLSSAVYCYINSTGGFRPASANTVVLGGNGSEYAEFDSRVIFARHLNASRTYYNQNGDADLFINCFNQTYPARNTYINCENTGTHKVYINYFDQNNNFNFKFMVNGIVGVAEEGIENFSTQGDYSGQIGLGRKIRTGGSWNSRCTGWQIQNHLGQLEFLEDNRGLIAYITSGGFISQGYITALSDIRHKTVIRDAAVRVEDIARMPAVMYQWNDGREDKELHVGSIAQNWQTVLPEVVLKANDEEGTLSMQYGVAALVSSIIIARKVVNHEERIEQLEKENKELKERLNIA